MEFSEIKQLIEEYNENELIINKLKGKYFLGVGYNYESYEGTNKYYNKLDERYSNILINELVKRNTEIELLIRYNKTNDAKYKT